MNAADRAARDAASPMMTPGEVASAFRVDTRTVTRWANDGKISFILTPGGHRRYPRAEVEKLIGDTKRGGES